MGMKTEIKKCLILTLMLTFGSIGASAANYWTGDVNADGKVTLADLDALVKMVQGKKTVTRRADVNHDGRVSIADIAKLIDILRGVVAPEWYREDAVDIPVVDNPGKFDVKKK